jgi:hypothetical protein
MRLPASPQVRLLLGVSLVLFCLIAASTGSVQSGLEAVALFIAAVRPVDVGDGLAAGWCELRVGKGSSSRVVDQLQRWRVTASGTKLYPIGAPFERVWTSVTPGALTVRATYDDAQLWGRIGEVTLRNPAGEHTLRFRLGSRFWRVRSWPSSC